MINYTPKYYAKLKNFYNDDVIISIDKLNYTGTSKEIKITNCRISYNYKDLFTPAIGTGLELSILNNLPDWYELEDILTAYNRQFYVTIIQSGATYSTTIFEGFVLSDSNEQSIQENSTISIKATNQIAQLSERNFLKSFSGATINKPIKYIAEILQTTGLVHEYYVNCSLYETSMNYNNLMHELRINKHLFSDEEANYDDLLICLNRMLKPFNMFVFLYNQAWYIERLFDYQQPKTYFIFDSEDIDNYSYYKVTGNTVTTITHTTGSTYNKAACFKYVDSNQKLEYAAGYKEIAITCKTKSKQNLVNEGFGNAAAKSATTEGDNPILMWYYNSGCTLSAGYDRVTFNGKYAYGNKIGIYSKVYINYSEELTKFNIRFKRIVTGATEIANATMYHCYYQIWDWANNKSFVYSNLTNYAWKYGTKNTTEVCVYNAVKLEYDNDEGYYYWNIDISVDLSCSNLSYGYHILEVRLLGGWWQNTDATLINQIYSPTFDKIRVTQNQDNSINDIELTGSINENYYGKINEEIELFDTKDMQATSLMLINYASWDGIEPYASDNWQDARTSKASLRNLSLQKMYIESLMQQLNKPRKTLKADILYKYPLQPLSIIRDVNIKRNDNVIDFLLMGYELDVCSCIYTITAQEVVIDDNYIIPV